MKRFRRGALVLAAFALSLLIWIPLVMLLSGSLTARAELVEKLGPVLGGAEGYARWPLLPQYPSLQPYVELLLDTPQFFVLFWNSILLTFGALAGQLIVAVPAAWWFARCKGRAGNGLFALYIVLMLLPFQVTMVSSYLVLDALSLLDTHWSILLCAAFSTFPVFIMYRFFRGIPPAVIEAARIDGASEFQIFLRIGLPLGKTGVASAMVLGFLEYWNLIEQPMTFLKTKALWPLSLYLPQITMEKLGIALAASVVTLLPPLLVFLYGQSYLEKGIAASGVKE